MSSEAPARPEAPRPRPPRALNVVFDPPPQEVGAPIDWSTWYLTDEEDMGQGNEQSRIIAIFCACLVELARRRGWNVFVGTDQFFAWVAEEPLVRVSPDVYTLDRVPPPPLPASWQTWKPGHLPPGFALEVVSGDERHPDRWRKDYLDGPQKYAQLGARELVIFDPEAATGRARDAMRTPLQLYRREADGSFVRLHAGAGPFESVELGAVLTIVSDGDVARLRLATDTRGHELVPTTEEARAEAEAARVEAEAARVEAEAARVEAEAARDAEREAREAAQAELAALRERLERRPDE